PGLFHTIAGAVAHRPGNHVNVPCRGASGGSNIQIIARTQAEMTGGFQFRPAQLDIPTAQAERLAQGILQIGA
ncbi:hypothetical protein ID853_18560, partial [Xenorhabdus sp. Vera]|uniref:hypothetical protein n=1 Tax=Xenorhabdus koppenhoeferi TaxID=351659 RepID=UPI00199E7EE8